MKPLARETPVTTGRLQNARAQLEGQQCSVETLLRLLASTDQAQPAFSVCSGTEPGATSGSISAEVIDPGSKTLHFCFGWPTSNFCTSDAWLTSYSWSSFKPFSLAHCPDGELVDFEGNVLS